MPIPKPTFTPPFNIVRISHVEWGVTDMDYCRDFYLEMVGYHCEEDLGDILYLRGMEEFNHHSLVLVKADEPSVHRIAFKVASEDDLDKAETFFASKGQPTAWVDKHAQGRTLHTTDPFGVPLEFYYRMDRGEDILQKYYLYKGARIQRIDHVNLFTNDVDAHSAFYVSELGFRLTEITLADIKDENSPMWAAWMHRRGGVHDIAFTNGLGPRLHHIGVYVSTATEIIDFCDRLASSDYIDAFERGPGRHGIANAFFLYMFDRHGHRIELFASDYMTVDPDHPARIWDLRDPRRQTLWGQAAPRTWFEKGMHFKGLEPKSSVIEGSPIIAPD
ncbi:MAG: 3,4-dihydroxyphenylacetate 2,3-dioxygenase [Chloroflexota bacterium]